MRVARRKSDGKIMDAQSNDSAPMDALRLNIAAQGLNVDDFDYVVMNGTQFSQQIAAQNTSAPRVVTMRQARLALHEAGLLESVATALEAMEGDAGVAARIEWEYATEVARDWPLVAQLGAALELTEQQLDALFEQAATK